MRWTTPTICDRRRGADEGGIVLPELIDDIPAAVHIGFRPALSHLAPLGLRDPRGHIVTRGTRAMDEPRLHLRNGSSPARQGCGAAIS